MLCTVAYHGKDGLRVAMLSLLRVLDGRLIRHIYLNDLYAIPLTGQ